MAGNRVLRQEGQEPCSSMAGWWLGWATGTRKGGGRWGPLCRSPGRQRYSKYICGATWENMAASWRRGGLSIHSKCMRNELLWSDPRQRMIWRHKLPRLLAYQLVYIDGRPGLFQTQPCRRRYYMYLVRAAASELQTCLSCEATAGDSVRRAWSRWGSR
jgi:hypothetical protein